MSNNIYTINANELKDKHQEKCRKRVYIYNKILEKCYIQIKKSCDNELNYTIFIVPEFIVGIPLYNIAYCSAYIMYNLKKNNYNVKFYNPNIIFISWKYDLPEYFESNKRSLNYEESNIKNNMNYKPTKQFYNKLSNNKNSFIF